jgi:hypothetical protein
MRPACLLTDAYPNTRAHLDLGCANQLEISSSDVLGTRLDRLHQDRGGKTSQSWHSRSEGPNRPTAEGTARPSCARISVRCRSRPN